MIKLLATILLSSSLLLASNFGKIATGNIDGTYIEIGKDLNRLLEDYKVDLEVIDTNGSAQNLDLLTGDKSKGDDIYWAIVQKDALKYYKYKYPSKDIENSVKLVFPIYNEAVHIIVKKGSKLTLKENRNFKVAVSSKNSGSYITAQYLESAYNVKFDYIFAKFNIAKGLLDLNQIDMYIEVIGLGNDKFKNLKDVDLLELSDNSQASDTYKKIEVDNNTYSWLNKPRNIYSIPSVIATNVIDKQNDQSIEAFIKIILANYKHLQRVGNTKWKEINFKYFKDIDSSYHPKAIETYKTLNLMD